MFQLSYVVGQARHTMYPVKGRSCADGWAAALLTDPNVRDVRVIDVSSVYTEEDWLAGRPLAHA